MPCHDRGHGIASRDNRKGREDTSASSFQPTFGCHSSVVGGLQTVHSDGGEGERCARHGHMHVGVTWTSSPQRYSPPHWLTQHRPTPPTPPPPKRTLAGNAKLPNATHTSAHTSHTHTHTHLHTQKSQRHTPQRWPTIDSLVVRRKHIRQGH
jgi:hypothetical protein